MRCIHESNHLTHTSSVEIFDFWPSRLDRDEPPDRCAAPLQGWWKHELNRYCAVTDALTCGKDAHRIAGEEKTSDSDGPGDPSPLPRLPCSSLNRFVSGPHRQPEHAIWSVLSEITIFLSDL